MKEKVHTSTMLYSEGNASTLVVEAKALSKHFRGKNKKTETLALKEIDFKAEKGKLTALIGPDGAGKTTLLRLIAGLLEPTGGELKVLGLTTPEEAEKIQALLSYMPQRFGLYEDLSVAENMELYAKLHGIDEDSKQARFQKLLAMTGLEAFTNRPAGKLSGGMKQKLGLACTLVRSPKLLLLDEPTVGVDPLSRKELWDILQHLVKEEGLSILVSTAYMDEAELCDEVYILQEGRFLAQGKPEELCALTKGQCFEVKAPKGLLTRNLQSLLLSDEEHVLDAVPSGKAVRFIKRKGVGALPWLKALGLVEKAVPSRLEDSFMKLLKKAIEERNSTASVPVLSDQELLHEARSLIKQEEAKKQTETVEIRVRNLLRTFGDFTAVAYTSFDVHKGEVFGLLGPNGAGKTTTFRMLCGLLPASDGELEVAGIDVRTSRAAARAKLGYVAQKFSLYSNLTVLENLKFFGSIYGLRKDELDLRLKEVLKEFKLEGCEHREAGSLPGGYKQRLSMAAALLHKPQILFLDEPTSGIDPVTRRNFWHQITELSQKGTTIIITTHFMEEAEYCDRMMIQDAGKLLAIGTPEEVREQTIRKSSNMNEVFIDIVLEARRRDEHA